MNSTASAGAGGLRALVLFIKHPQAGLVKTRLTPWLSPEEAADLYRAFIHDMIALSSRVDGIRRMVAYAPADALAPLQALIGAPDLLWFAQTGAALGDRLRAAFDAAFEQGAAKVVVMGSDSPTLPLACIREAFDALDTHDVVVGPASDGGYYLIGIAKNETTRLKFPALFADIPWSTGAVYERSVQAIRAAGLSYTALPVWDDADEPGDLLRLRDQIRMLRKEGEFALARHTERMLEHLRARLDDLS